MSPSRRRSVALVYTTALLQGAFGVTLAASSAVLRERLRLGDVAYGGVFLLLFVAAFAASLSGSCALRRFSLKGLFVFGLGTEAVTLSCFALSGVLPPAPGIAALLLGVTLGGIAIGALGISLNTAALDLFPGARGGALSTLHGFLGAGAAVWPMVVAAAAARGAWPTAPLLLAAAYAALFLLAISGPLHGLADAVVEEHARADLAPRLRWRALTATLYGAGESVFTVWAVVLLYERRHLPLAVAAGALSAFWVAMTGGRLVATILLRAASARTLALVLAAGMSFSFILVATSSGPLGSVLAFAAAGLFCSALFPLLFVLAADELPARGPQVSGIFSAAVLAGLAVGAFGVGPLRAPLGLERIYLMSSIIPLLLAGVLLRLSVEPKRLPVSREG